MSLFQRIKTPFGEVAEDGSSQPQRRAHAVGELLRERRRELGLDLETIGEALRIKPVFLTAIEQGRTEDLPGPAYAIGFVRAYAHYLGFDGERVIDSYKAESAEVHARPDLTLPVPLGARSLPGGPILLVGLILALCGYGTWYYLATGERTRPERVAAVPAELRQSPQDSAVAPRAGTDGVGAKSAPTAASSSGAAAGQSFGSGLMPSPSAPPPAVDPGSPSPSPAAVASPATRAAAPVPVAAPAAAVSPAPAGGAAPGGAPASVRPAVAATGAVGSAGGAEKSIDIRALTDCWIQVRAADQAIVFSRVLKAGETYRVPRPGLFLRTGNAGALAVLVDGKTAPSLGAVGVLRRNVALEADALLAGTAVRG